MGTSFLNKQTKRIKQVQLEGSFTTDSTLSSGESTTLQDNTVGVTSVKKTADGKYVINFADAYRTLTSFNAMCSTDGTNIYSPVIMADESDEDGNSASNSGNSYLVVGLLQSGHSIVEPVVDTEVFFSATFSKSRAG